MLRDTFAVGDSDAVAAGIAGETIRQAWVEIRKTTFIAVAGNGDSLGTCFIKANQPGLGSHSCNAGYVVAPGERGRGVAIALCEHSQERARAPGSRAMQFNLVVSTNVAAVRPWQRLGFAIVGALPGACDHRVHGEVDAHAMFKRLV